jgi:hypothetical protein
MDEAQYGEGETFRVSAAWGGGGYIEDVTNMISEPVFLG